MRLAEIPAKFRREGREPPHRRGMKRLTEPPWKIHAPLSGPGITFLTTVLLAQRKPTLVTFPNLFRRCPLILKRLIKCRLILEFEFDTRSDKVTYDRTIVSYKISVCQRDFFKTERLSHLLEIEIPERERERERERKLGVNAKTAKAFARKFNHGLKVRVLPG